MADDPDPSTTSDKKDDGKPAPENVPIVTDNTQEVAAQVGQDHVKRRISLGTGSYTTTGYPPVFRVYGPLPEDHPFYALVGRVASEWAHLEHIVDLTIWGLLGVNEALAACLTSQYPGIGQRCNAVCSLGLARGLTKEQVKPFRQLRGEAYDVADWRARWVHDPWYGESGTNQPAQFRAMSQVDPRYGLQDISKDEVETTIKKIRELQVKATAAQKIVRDALAALLEKQA